MALFRSTALTSCPDYEQLQALAAESLSAAAATAIWEHFDTCRRCPEVFEEIEVERQQRLWGTSSISETETDAAPSRRKQLPTAEKAVTGDSDRHVLTPGTTIGRYRIGDLLGSGGMGSVYHATRSSEVDAEVEVAFKLIRSNFGSADSDILSQVLMTECRVLARLNHPSIARFIDAGVCEYGPYLATEFVRNGTPIDVYCNGHSSGEEEPHSQCLTVTERLKLFQQVCAAIEACHSALLLHNDITSRNILVSPDGIPRVIDLAVAQGLASDTPEWTGPDASQTKHEQASTAGIFSPHYASPERMQGQPLNVTSDVFSLGVLLYRLLADTHPYRLEGKPRSECVIEMAMPKVTPLALSACFDKEKLGVRKEDVPQMLERWNRVASRRKTTLPHLRAMFSGDLDAIAAKAVHRDPAERYQTVQELAADIDRYLEFRPVAARPGTVGYQLRRFIRRNRILSAATIVLLTVVLLSSVIIFGKNQELLEANLETEQQATIAIELLVDGYGGAQEYLRGVPFADEARSRLAETALNALTSIQSRSRQSNLRVQYAEMDALIRVGDYLLEKNGSGGSFMRIGESDTPLGAVTDRMVRYVLKRSSSNDMEFGHSKVASEADRVSEDMRIRAATDAFRSALTIADTLSKEDIIDPVRRDFNRAICLARLGLVAASSDDVTESRDWFIRAIDCIRGNISRPKDEFSAVLSRERVLRELIAFYWKLSDAEKELGNVKNAIAATEQSLSIAAEVFDDEASIAERARLVYTHADLADLHHKEGSRDKAIVQARKAFELQISIWKDPEKYPPLSRETFSEVSGSLLPLANAIRGRSSFGVDLGSESFISGLRLGARWGHGMAAQSYFQVSRRARSLAALLQEDGQQKMAIRVLADAARAIEGAPWSAQLINERHEAIALAIEALTLAEEFLPDHDDINSDLVGSLLTQVEDFSSLFIAERRTENLNMQMFRSRPGTSGAELSASLSLVEELERFREDMIPRELAVARIIVAAGNRMTDNIRGVALRNTQQELDNLALTALNRLKASSNEEFERVKSDPTIQKFIQEIHEAGNPPRD